MSSTSAHRHRPWTATHLEAIPALRSMSPADRLRLRALALVLPFRVNEYVVEELIDWSSAPDDPMYRLLFPQPEMLDAADLERLEAALRRGEPPAALRALAAAAHARMNPHPAGQTTLNVPVLDGERLWGVQHKYRETVLFFPAAGQTCHAYCTYCFRWAQFVGDPDLRMAARSVDPLVRYLRRHPEVTDVLLTGGDPMVMGARRLRAVVEPLLQVPTVRSIRIGSKSLAWWPHRFLSDPDADEVLRLFEEVVASGRHLAFMAHFSHPRELEPEPARRALARIRATGAVVRCQNPVVRRVNDDPEVLAELWRREVALGAVPYYLFVARDTGPRAYFEVPLARAWRIASDAVSRVGGLARTVRGPSMSCTPGKVLVDGIVRVGGERAFVLKFLQARRPEWTHRVFLARFDPRAAWIDDLRPLDGDRFFFEEEEVPADGPGTPWAPGPASLPVRGGRPASPALPRPKGPLPRPAAPFGDECAEC